MGLRVEGRRLLGGWVLGLRVEGRRLFFERGCVPH